MCFPTPKASRPTPRSSHHQSEKDRFRTGSSSGSATDGSLPLSPDLRKRQLPVGRVATSHSRPGSSSAKYSATPPTRRKSTRRDGGRASASATPGRKSSNRGSAITSPDLSDLNYKISGATPRTKNTTPRIVRTPAVSTQTTPRIGITPAESPRKGSSLKAYSTTSSQGRLSVATADVASLAASTSPLLRPSGGGSSRASSDAGSSRTGGSDTRERKRSSKATGLEGSIGLGITTEVSPKKKRTSATPKRTASVKVPVTAPVAVAVKPVAPAPTIKVHSVTLATSSLTDPAPEIPSSVVGKSPVGPSVTPPEAKTATVLPLAQQPQRPPFACKNAYVAPRKGSSSSLSSDYSDSASSDSTVEAAVPELSRKAPGWALIPPPVASTSKPATLPEPVPEKEPVKEPMEKATEENAKEPQTPVASPKLVVPTAEPTKQPGKEPANGLVEEKHPPPPPIPQTLTKKPSPTRDGRASSRASTETVDYAAFVAESQKKKKQQKLNPALDATPTTTGSNRRSNSIRARAALFSAPATAAPALVVREDTARKNAIARMKIEADTDSDSDSDASTEVSSVAPATDGEFPHRLQLRRQSKPAAKTFYETDSSSVLSYRMDGARPEVPFPPPYAPSPPPISRRGSARVQQHVPPQGAAESWYMDVGAGPREVEQNWVNSAEIWEQDPVLPEAPSPPVSRTEDRQNRRRRSQRKNGHGYGHGGHRVNGYYDYVPGRY